MKNILTLLLGTIFILSMLTSAVAIHEEVPAETQKTDQPSATFISKTSRQAQDPYTLKALVNLLEKKGIITKEELNKEIESLKSKK